MTDEGWTGADAETLGCYVCTRCGSACYLLSVEYPGDGVPTTTCPWDNGEAEWRKMSQTPSLRVNQESQK